MNSKKTQVKSRSELMRRVLYLLSLLIFLSACQEYASVSDAYGNFECEEIIISSETAGILQDFRVSEGQSIVQNQLIAVIDTTDLALQKREIELQLELIKIKQAKVKSEREVIGIELSKASRDVEKNRVLYDIGALALDILENYQYQEEILQTQYSASLLNYSSLDSEKSQLKVKLQAINHELSKCFIKSPLTGTVLTKYVQQGELLTKGKSVIKIADLSATYLKAYVTQTQLSSLALNQTVRILIDDNAGLRELTGSISYISSKAEFTPKTIQTRDERANLVYAIKISLVYEDAIKMGMPAEVLFGAK
jgi:HlyD family secretion protein